MRMVAKILGIVLGVITIILGLYCLFTPGMAYLSLGYCVGFAMVMDSITEICFWWVAKSEGKADGWMLAGAILSLVFGFFVLNSALLRLSIDIFIAYYVAIWLIIRGGIVIARAFQLRKYHHDYNTIKVGKQWYLPLVVGILMILFGLLCCFNPAIMASAIGIFIGLGIVSSGASLVTYSLMAE